MSASAPVSAHGEEEGSRAQTNRPRAPPLRTRPRCAPSWLARCKLMWTDTLGSTTLGTWT